MLCGICKAQLFFLCKRGCQGKIVCMWLGSATVWVLYAKRVTYQLGEWSLWGTYLRVPPQGKFISSNFIYTQVYVTFIKLPWNLCFIIRKLVRKNDKTKCLYYLVIDFYYTVNSELTMAKWGARTRNQLKWLTICTLKLTMSRQKWPPAKSTWRIKTWLSKITQSG